ncbi:UDP-glucose dehydrogenase family protein [Candidatus Vallotiella sp. (ex Adelges kitamiensis)]|uniref:UDP-glucose dehydrogenase family protein n=1 Tax=Candidatus Vallotiella sp. (ex Adelges kitamiensis) TaxID=2864217 RepID=UPI001CE2FF5C|nr:UDP-glucose/GDP-mannose dehydrogenase family protein [Candidatus Vallotia sp. (ex Adelges kitamiensis)]
MKTTIIGTGYVGLVTGACLAELGNDVFCLDIDPHKIEILNTGGVTIYEPGLKDLIDRNRAAGRLQFSTQIETSVTHGDIQFIAVDTPADEAGSADLHYVLTSARNIGRYMQDFKVIVNKSTVPVGTAERVAAVVAKELSQREVEHSFSVVSNPEFLKEGAAVDDFMHPDRIVIGSEDDEAGEYAREQMRRLYKPLNQNYERTMYMNIRSAEFTKYAANAMLATRISFMNELANLAEQVGVDIEAVRRGVGSDPRIGYGFLYAGAGYGGSCFPKDIQALMCTAEEYKRPLKILEAVEAVNEAQKSVLVNKITARLGPNLNGRTVAVWGLAFKPNTDDMREAPSRRLIIALLRRGAMVRAYDPVAMQEAQRVFALDLRNELQVQARLSFVSTQAEAVSGADALAIMTEWKAFKSPDFSALKRALKVPLVFDGRNLYEPNEMAEFGIEYYAIGRASVLTNVSSSDSRRV